MLLALLVELMLATAALVEPNSVTVDVDFFISKALIQWIVSLLLCPTVKRVGS